MLETGWGAGLCFTLLAAISFLIPLGKTRDWTDYGIVGGTAAIFILTAIISRFCNLPPSLRSRLCTISKYLVLSGAAASLAFTVPITFYKFLCLGWILIIGCAYRIIKQNPHTPLKITLKRYAPPFLLGVCVFSACAALLRANKVILITSIFTSIPTDSLYDTILKMCLFPLLFAFCGGLCSTLIFQKSWAQRPYIIKKPWNLALHVGTAFVLTVLCFRTQGLTTEGAAHHWKAIVEPAAALRSGGWLLWDTPSQYGVLLTWLLATMPTASVWQSLYLLNGTLLTASGIVIFFLLFSRNHSIAGYFMAFFVTYCSITLLETITMSDHRVCPSGGVLRFVWMYIILGYTLTLWHLHNQRQALLPSPLIYGIGCIVWLCGVLWSVESALYSTALWLPIAMIVALARWTDNRTSVKKLALTAGLILLSHLASLALIVSCIALYYKQHLGQWPDFGLFSIYLTAYNKLDEKTMIFHLGGLYAIPINPRSSVLSCLAVFWASCTLAYAYIISCKPSASSLYNASVLYGSLATLWLICSYYITRSHEQNIINLIPLVVYALACILFILPTLEVSETLNNVYKAVLACFFSVVIFPIFSNYAIKINLSQDHIINTNITNIQTVSDAPLAALITKAGITDASPVLDVSEEAYPGKFVLTPWLLPNTVTGFAFPLSPTLYQQLAERRAAKSCKYGWTIEKKDDPLANYPWIAEAIAAYYKQMFQMENDKWRIRKFEKLIEAPC